MSSAEKQADTEKRIRERLEQSGQLAKMRAMIVDAALQSLSAGQSAESTEKLFLPSAALASCKSSPAGRQALGTVYAYLRALGLQYTANVLAVESGCSTDELSAAVPAGTVADAAGVTAALAGTVPVSAAPTVELPASPTSASPPAEDSEEVEEAAPVGVEKSTDDSSADEKESAESAESDAAEEPPQPGAEDSTYYISKWKKKTFVRAGQVAGQQVQVEYLTDCTVIVLDPLDSMTVDDCEGGELIVASCEGSVFLRNCKNMTVHVACKQLRTRDCANIDLHIFTTTDPVVEMSHHMTFRPFHLRLPSLRKSFKDARLDPAVNRFVHVYDFTVDESSLPQPHFTVMYPEHGVAMEDRCADRGTPECPPEIEDLLSMKLLPAASSESGQNKSYDIKTGAAAWTAAPALSATETVEKVDSPPEDSVSSNGSANATQPAAAVAAVPAAAPLTVPSAGQRPPVAPHAVVPAAGTAALGGLDDQDYSSFDDSSDSESENDKYKVDEDDDDF